VDSLQPGRTGDLQRAAARAAGAGPEAELLDYAAEPVVGSSGAATVGVVRLTGRVRSGKRCQPFTMIRKTCGPTAARDQTHWAYWRRELLAYGMGLVPDGPHLTAPPCLAVTEDAVFLAEVTGAAEKVAVAARRLGAWQATTPVPDVCWLARPVEFTPLVGAKVDAPVLLRRIWECRERLLATLDAVPQVLSHGDFHRGHLIASDDVTVVLDWGTLGVGPLGGDLAHLALSACEGAAVGADEGAGADLLPDYLEGLAGRFDESAAARGYLATLVLTAASRAHWMLSHRIPVPPGYLDLAGEAFTQLRKTGVPPRYAY
jgi:hypothetical protein